MAQTNTRRTELLAPAGDWESLRAAVANGADAVYFGLSDFNARHRATNFTLPELPEVMDYLHRHNVCGYVAFNTLIFSDELPHAVEFISAIVAAGADAVIVQDLGLAKLVRQVAPGLAIHGSTQMTLTEPRGIEFVRTLGVERVIVARELSLDEIGRIAAQTKMELEVFVHGALCVAYSGQCLTSEALGGRSANRGQCAQACRLPYDLFVDGHERDTGDRHYLLSPQDLAAYDLVDPLVKLGVRSLKIEGRLKSAEYVAITSQTYRAALDAALSSQSFQLEREQQLNLQQSFSRGFSHGFLDGVNHQILVPARFPKSRGVLVGTVVAKTDRGVLVKLAAGLEPDILQPGAGVCFDEGHPEQDEQGGRVVEVQSAECKMQNGELKSHQASRDRQGAGANRSSGMRNGEKLSGAKHLEVRLLEGSVNLAAVTVGCLVWKTDDPAFRREMAQSYARDLVVRREPVDFVITGRLGDALRLEVRDAWDNIGRAVWEGPLQVARKHPVTEELLRDQLGRLGDTPFELGSISSDLSADAMIPKSVLNDLRRQAVTELTSARENRRNRTIHRHMLDELRGEIQSHRSENHAASTPALTVLTRNFEQLEAVLAWQPPTSLPPLAMVYCDFEDVRRYREAVPLARAAGIPIGLATLRIVKPSEEGLLRTISKAGPDAVLVRNLAALVFFRETLPQCRLIGDFSLNVANELTADLFFSEGLSRLTPSYDLNWDQLATMLGRIDPARFEIVVHQQMPMFHMEHCVFAAMLSGGKDATDCGRPCDRHRVELRDRVGAAFPLLADTGCRNTVFNSVAQSAAEYIPKMLDLGVHHFRVELLRETKSEVAPLLERYARVIAGLDSPQQAWRSLQVLNQLGVTRGTLQLA
jgi:U32 family peptidase